MKEINFENVPEEEYPEVALKLIDFAGKETIWLFNGNLGAGKTTLIGYICKALGVTEDIQSPTFSIVNEHLCDHSKIYHFDCYRLETYEEALDFGMEEYLDSGHLCLIEWPDRIEELLPDNHISIELSQSSGGGRNINVKCNP